LALLAREVADRHGANANQRRSGAAAGVAHRWSGLRGDRHNGGMPPLTAEEIVAAVPGLRTGLVPAVAQQWDTGEVLMVAWVDTAALEQTLRTRRATYYSRSRKRLWTKGETSGHTQQVRSVAVDCDGDTLLYRVDQTGPACHTGTRTCFDGRVLLDAGEPA
jgi:phosphoribosyl-AMP cyclohydrolase